MKNKKQTKKSFKQLTEDDKLFIAETHANKELSFDDRIDILRQQYGKSERTIRKWTEKLGLTKPNIPKSPQYETAKKKKVDKSKKIYLITSAQSNTGINDHMLNNMEAYAKKIKAEIIIIPLKYSFDMLSAKDHTWHSRTVKYLNANRFNLNKNLTVCGDVKIIPTAKWPLSGMDSLTGLNSAVYGGVKQHMESKCKLYGDSDKIMVTTGALTKPNYSDSKAGKHGEAFHEMGFVIVEVEDKEIFHIRQVNVHEDGSFSDLFYHVSGGKVTRDAEVEAMIFGDLHLATVDEELLETSLKMAKKLNVKKGILHDVFDGQSCNPHNIKDFHIQYSLEVTGKNDLRGEINDMLDKLGRFNFFEDVVVVKSNHDLFLERYLKEDWRKMSTLKNSLEYMELSAKLLRAIKEGSEYKGVIPMLIKEAYPNYTTLGYEESYFIEGFAVNYHSHKGPNGAKSGPKTWTQFASTNKCEEFRGSVVAHSHFPSKYGKGTFRVGELLLPQEYCAGSPSSWMATNCIIHKGKNGNHATAQLINIINGNKYTTFK